MNTRRVRHTSRCTSGEGVVSAIAPVALQSFKNVTIALKTQPNALNCDNVLHYHVYQDISSEPRRSGATKELFL